ncbi:MAG TPA: tyrosine--tRNA ligase [Acidimicrobiia bacterium]|nr:tyrosine--tRNA ligase [Acidimicrobiia bacterium]
MGEPDVEEQLRVLTAGAVDVITEADLRRKLGRGVPLRVKLGIDPTASDIHLGFAVVLRKLRQFQELGHVAVLIIGDFTAQVGDPSGKSATRPRLSKAEVEAHAATYVEQVRRILSPDGLEIRRNSEWLGAMGIEDVLRLAARTTVARMLERNDFAQRYRDGSPISVMEFLYPLLQGWDSVMVRADVELGGTDQLFNNLVGRTLQEQEGQEGQVVLTTPLLEGLDGTQKMSKSLNNFVGIAEAPAEQYGKLMSLPDVLMPRYFLLTTGWHPDRVEEVTNALEGGSLAPVDAKRLLARTVVDLSHGEGAGAEAEAAFDRVFRRHDAPEEIPEHVLDPAAWADGRIRLAALLHECGLVPSNREGARMIRQGAVRRDGEPVTDPDLVVAVADLDGATLQVGKRRWVRLRLPGNP